MQIAILSGKGGTGKTFVSVNLASVAQNAIYVDCDVEEPNGHLFLKPTIQNTTDIEVQIPDIDKEICIGCRQCVDVCQFGALAFIREKPMLFDQICHSCGGCSIVCPVDAICEKPKEVGSIEEGTTAHGLAFTGRLKLGEASGVPVIKALLQKVKKKTEDIFVDCPPGSACIVMESIQDADFCILVAEPTVFGVHNLAMVYELVQLWKKPVGVVLNKCNEEWNPAEDFCIKNQVPILGKIPFDHDLGTKMAKGEIAVEQEPKMKEIFLKIYDTIGKEVAK